MGDKETCMILTEARQTASQFPLPEFGKDMSREMQLAFVSMARQQAFGNALMLSSECELGQFLRLKFVCCRRET